MVPEYEIFPNVGVGKLRFGSSISSVRQIVDSEYVTTVVSEDTVRDFYESCLFSLHYFEQKLDGIEFFPPNTVLFDGIDLFSMKYGDVKAFMVSKDQETEEEMRVGIKSTVLGLSIYCPNNNPADLKDPRFDPSEFGIVESIFVFERSHYTVNRKPREYKTTRGATVDDIKKMVGLD